MPAEPAITAIRPQSTLRRAARQKLGGKLSSVLQLPPPTTDFTIDRRLRVPMRDGVDLLADHYIPQTTGAS